MFTLRMYMCVYMCVSVFKKVKAPIGKQYHLVCISWWLTQMNGFLSVFLPALIDVSYMFEVLRHLNSRLAGVTFLKIFFPLV